MERPAEHGTPPQNFGDRPFFLALLLVVTFGLLYTLRSELSPVVLGGAILVLVVMIRRGTRIEMGVGIITGVLIGAWFLTEVAQLLWPFAIAFALAYLLAPLVNILSRRLPRGVAIGVIVLLMVGVLSGIGAVVIPKVIDEVGDLVNRLPNYGDEMLRLYYLALARTQRLGIALPVEDIRQWAVERLPALGKVFANQTTTALKGISSGLAALLNLLMIPFVAFYLLKDYEKLGAICKRLLPPRHAPAVWDVMGQVNAVLGQYVRGQMLVCSFIAVLTSIGLGLSGIPYAVLLGLMAGAFNLVPYVGLTISLGVSSIVALLDVDPWTELIKVVVVFAVVQGIEGNFLSPKVVGERVGLHPVWVMFAVVVSAHFWGVVGMLIAIPFAAVINVWVRILSERYFQSRYYGRVSE